jgi:hypothetical protein
MKDNEEIQDVNEDREDKSCLFGDSHIHKMSIFTMILSP